ncbi:hypothetical protein AGMMS49936_04950 [Endomicrobiia bacterium]|nr:hypothetical protein AGMMS49936_04950 [Endomicrobiia bacterium]
MIRLKFKGRYFFWPQVRDVFHGKTSVQPRFPRTPEFPMAAVTHKKANIGRETEPFQYKGVDSRVRFQNPHIAGKNRFVKTGGQGRFLPIPHIADVGVADKGGLDSRRAELLQKGEIFFFDTEEAPAYPLKPGVCRAADKFIGKVKAP